MFGRENCEEYLFLWHQVREMVVEEVLLSAAFMDVNFVRCLLDPRITEFCHVLPGGHDNYWAYPGQSIHGKLLTKMREVMISVATQLHHYLHNPYTITGLNKIYLGLYLSTSHLPSKIKFLPIFHYPPHTSLSPSILKFHPPKHSATGYDDADWDDNIEVVPVSTPKPSVLAPKYTDVRLRDNPSLQQSWKPSDNSTSSKSSVLKPVPHPISKSPVIDPIPVPKPRA